MFSYASSIITVYDQILTLSYWNIKMFVIVDINLLRLNSLMFFINRDNMISLYVI